ncbi:MAG: nitrous oxide-stimulated promoter family protein [Firmicutes bacterium]|nr:nitrous oxide-stimulated promoter family protein [Bacillota bacterium]
MIILASFIELYCKHHHDNQDTVMEINKELMLCSECYDLLKYAVKRRRNCPKDPKPACKNCDTHCYGPKYQREIRQVMKYSGKQFVKKGRIDYLLHYFL